MKNWDELFIEQTKLISAWSKDPSTKVGALIVRPDKTVCSQGYNGFARGVVDSDERISNRETKYAITLHAEINALLSAKESVEGYTLYVYPLPPCAHCASAIIQSGIKRVVFRTDGNGVPERWQGNIDLSMQLFKEAGVEVSNLWEC